MVMESKQVDGQEVKIYGRDFFSVYLQGTIETPTMGLHGGFPVDSRGCGGWIVIQFLAEPLLKFYSELTEF
jgi:hypothetical protein